MALFKKKENNKSNNSLEKITKLANNGDAKSQYELAIMFYNGTNVERDYKKALDLLTKSAEQGNVEAQIELANCYKDGKVIEQNYTKAVEWLTKAAKQGNPIAQNNLGAFYFLGIGVEKNVQKALVLIQKAAEQRYYLAYYSLSQFYKKGEGVKQDLNKAIGLIEKSLETEFDYNRTIELIDLYKITNNEKKVKEYSLGLLKKGFVSENLLNNLSEKERNKYKKSLSINNKSHNQVFVSNLAFRLNKDKNDFLNNGFGSAEIFNSYLNSLAKKIFIENKLKLLDIPILNTEADEAESTKYFITVSYFDESFVKEKGDSLYFSISFDKEYNFRVFSFNLEYIDGKKYYSFCEYLNNPVEKKVYSYHQRSERTAFDAVLYDFHKH